ncbi:hypothetical protein VNI00_009833 [Paramarasmius palmivorus]|uniref:Uncharacterized protein n=1 Tax=Paramarasmius palmivorus TaxID=297713 RepID=A0AAW0CPY5_9AGAR
MLELSPILEDLATFDTLLALGTMNAIGTDSTSTGHARQEHDVEPMSFRIENANKYLLFISPRLFSLSHIRHEPRYHYRPSPDVQPAALTLEPGLTSTYQWIVCWMYRGFRVRCVKNSGRGVLGGLESVLVVICRGGPGDKRNSGFSWFRKDQEQDQDDSTPGNHWTSKAFRFSFKKRFSFSRKMPTSTPMPMPVVTVTRVRVEEDDYDGFMGPKKIKMASTSPTTSDARERRRRPLSSSKKRFSALFAPSSTSRGDLKAQKQNRKRYSSVGVQTGESERPVCPRVSRESRFIEELGEGEEEDGCVAAFVSVHLACGCGLMA